MWSTLRGHFCGRIYPPDLLSPGSLGEYEIAEVGFLRRSVSRPEHKNLAALLGAVRAMQLAGLGVKRRAGQVLLALVDKITFDHVEHLRNARVEVWRDDRAWLQDEVEHNRAKRVIHVSDGQGDVPLAWEGEALRLDLRRENLLVEHGVLICSVWLVRSFKG